MYPKIGIREATDADLSFIADVLNREILESPYIYAETPVTLDERRTWIGAHRSTGLPVLVATEPSGALLGWGSLSAYRPSTGYRFAGEVSVYVHRAAQRRGAGARLLASLVGEAKGRGLRSLVASIDSENAPSVALFERAGFAEVGRLPGVGWKLGAERTQLLLYRRL